MRTNASHTNLLMLVDILNTIKVILKQNTFDDSDITHQFEEVCASYTELKSIYSSNESVMNLMQYTVYLLNKVYSLKLSENYSDSKPHIKEKMNELYEHWCAVVALEN